MSTAPKITSYDVIFEYFQKKKIIKFLKVETLDFKPFLPHMSSEMILLEVAPSNSPKQSRQNRNGFVYYLKNTCVF